MSKELHFEMRQEELAHLLTEVENGNTQALPLYAEIKQIKDLFTKAEKQIEPFAMDEAEQYPEKTFQENGFEFQKRNGATRYSYKNIPEWKNLNAKIKECEDKHKQAFLSKQKGILIADENGEEIVLPEISYSKNSLSVKKIQSVA